MLGERVDLSEVRSLIAANDIAGAQRAFNATGLAERARAQGMFSVDMLQKAVGSAIQAGGLATPYQEGSKLNTASNDGFLAATQAATGNMKLEGARIDARQSIIQLQAQDLQRGLNDLFATDEMLTELEIQKIGTELNKFLDVTLKQIGEGITNPGGIFRLIANGGKAPTNPDILGVSRATNKLEGFGGLGAHPMLTETSQNAFDKTGKIATGTGGDKGYKMGNTSIPSTGRGIDYSIERPRFMEKDAINKQIVIEQIQQQELKNLNSHTETSIELLKSLRDLTAIMLDPQRTKDFNVQLNMDGKQIKNVLIRNNERDLGTTRDGLTFSTQGAKS
jgi:hypothetical protein